ncbi:MAG TPA: bifunctional 5,10-methylenetetrahydrofolate dehydrogenase/5,10-methenyltetrahydrofolate cyclohydrolase [Defluviitoga sp.]|nr:bifunctional 5,10-methylenetetrahydrofolate dehydrogenase/5,10-methenyltetrahydrofolate cyclohydrolase [Defluviitoga sp.]HOP23989.1 bifunctional 5,10-methylenetetrahydrofolate dehydrogenase/5,10-methenyltetrahydrofolate cyclohydrolase [Defluviitoga sp.]HPZ28924.1 bifunctional 5,10-methylenetetrahydrofolate dehydrogenase/5,10-methenyltetrahydrofolate cyclohydrolase [Defluviitoga sp.]HQD62310.1 bifunctional 5,10-methylenetetrahydrofolate dehydrogenase/5,10-methenyltetrahydrofolate cyclohydrolas
MYIDIKNIINELNEEIEFLKQKVTHEPKLISLVVEPDPSTLSYLKSQKRSTKKHGINLEIIESENLIDDLSHYNQDITVDGIFVARPLAKGYSELDIARNINPLKDVEGVSLFNIGSMYYEEELFIPCTAEAVVKTIENTTEIRGKNVVVIGRSTTVGKPVGILLLKRGRDATVTIAHSKTVNLQEITRKADILVVAVGKANFINKDFVKEGAIVIDVGINVLESKVVGDVSSDVAEKCEVTPVPGGVGNVTSLILIRNVFKAALDKNI